MTRIVLASGNAGKHRELTPLFAALGLELVTQTALGIDGGPEDAPTFVENALSKARHVARAAGAAVIADDSGLVVPALGGAPGVRSARYAEDHDRAGRTGQGTDADNNALLLERTADLDDRRAHFCCVLVVLRHAEDPLPLIAEGRWHGEILRAPRGEGGFGYDPLFRDPESGRSAAELSAAEKSGRSHRGRAVQALAPLLAQLGPS